MLFVWKSLYQWHLFSLIELCSHLNWFDKLIWSLRERESFIAPVGQKTSWISLFKSYWDRRRNPVDGTRSFTRTLDIAHTLLSVFSLSLELVLIPLIFVQKSQPFSINWKRKLADKFNLHTNFLFFCTFMSTKLKRTLLLFILWTKTFTNGFLKRVLFYSFVCLRRLAKFV